MLLVDHHGHEMNTFPDLFYCNFSLLTAVRVYGSLPNMHALKLVLVIIT